MKDQAATRTRLLTAERTELATLRHADPETAGGMRGKH
ncbi:hypothetical protein SBV1_460045 [Verrucomicrobia bacterium]|nr:hypothetical protein SBV1_460045 [Verrucomicrobiota bacterium]